MRKIVVGGFHQETNSFNPNIVGAAYLAKFTMEGDRILGMRGLPTPMSAFLAECGARGDKVIPSCFVFAQSGGRVDHAFFTEACGKICDTVREEKPDAVFLMLHGATQTTEADDGAGLLLEMVRDAAGNALIAASADMHANVTDRMLRCADILCGYRRYPHVDTYETGLRAARLGYRMLEGEKFYQAYARLPMLRAAGIYNTEEGAVGALMALAARRAEALGIEDYTVYQMQPWLDVSEAGSLVHAVSGDREAAEQFAREIAEELWRIRGQIVPALYSVEGVIARAKKNETGKPYLLVDAADSPNAGATGDNAYVLKKILELAPEMPSAFAVKDGRAAQEAFRLGVGAEAEFMIGGTYSPLSEKVSVKARVRSLHDGTFRAQGPMMKGTVHSMGPTAVLQAENCMILLCTDMIGSGDPQVFRSCGIEPLFLKLVNIKACTSFRAAYADIAGEIFETDTPGLSCAGVESLPFRKIPMPFSPFREPEAYEIKVKFVGREPS